MKLYTAFLVILLMVCTVLPLQAQPGNQIDPEIKSEVQSVLNTLSRRLDLFELYQKQLEVSGRNQKSYDENKNIWISTVLAVQAIASICENQLDLLNLFWDLRKSRQAKYQDILVRSLETSIRQIEIMLEQLRLNHRLLPPDLAEIDLFGKIVRNTEATLADFRVSIALITATVSD